MTARYDPVGTRCTSGPQPGTLNLANEVKRIFGGTNYGIYNCRYTRGSASSGGNLSFHAEGRAVDWAFGSRATTVRAIDWLIANQDHWGIQEIIDYAADRRWTSTRGWAYFAADPLSHIHFTQNWDGARGAKAPTTKPVSDPKPEPTEQKPPPEEEEDMITIQDPTKGFGKVVPGREPYFALDAKNKNLLGFNGASIMYDQPTMYGFRFIKIPSNAKVTGMWLKEYNDSGTRIRKPNTIVVTAEDGGTFHFKIS